MAKEVTGIIKLQIRGGAANPAGFLRSPGLSVPAQPGDRAVATRQAGATQLLGDRTNPGDGTA